MEGRDRPSERLRALPAVALTFDVLLDVRVEHGTRVQVHHGARETPARVTWLGGHFHQLRCEQPLAAARGDRLVLRGVAPPDAIGGVVLDPGVRRHGPSNDLLVRLTRLARGEDPGPEAPPGARRGAGRGA